MKEVTTYDWFNHTAFAFIRFLFVWLMYIYMVTPPPDILTPIQLFNVIAYGYDVCKDSLWVTDMIFRRER